VPGLAVAVVLDLRGVDGGAVAQEHLEVGKERRPRVGRQSDAIRNSTGRSLKPGA
jgi:hypothetical protein